MSDEKEKIREKKENDELKMEFGQVKTEECKKGKEEEERYDSAATALNFVLTKDDITGDDKALCVKMSCGHAVEPDSLKGWCQSLLNQGNIWFHCPADVDGSKCGKEWSYLEVRRHAMLTNEERRTFEETIAPIAAKQYSDYKKCPKCRTCVERKDAMNLRVCCVICTGMRNENSEFCWQCLRPWKGAGISSVRCENQDCADKRLELLEHCSVKDLRNSEIKKCPSIRACPTCGDIINHKDKCKYMLCKQCHVEFCFACLESANMCKASKSYAWYKVCSKPVAPRQTAIPVWSQSVWQCSQRFTAQRPPPQSHSKDAWCAEQSPGKISCMEKPCP